MCPLGVAEYANQHGKHVFGRHWPTSLRVVARLSWAFKQAPPLDFVVWRDSALEIGAGRGQLNGHDATWLFVAHAIKWPPAVWFFASRRRSRGPDRQSPQSMLEDVLATIHWASGQAWKVMHSHMSKGRMPCMTGLAVLAKDMGLLVACDESEAHVRLGAGQTGYIYSQDNARSPWFLP